MGPSIGGNRVTWGSYVRYKEVNDSMGRQVNDSFSH